MRTTSYQEILQVAVDHDGLSIGKLLTDDADRFRDFVSLALPIAWELENWPELLRMEERWFREFYAVGTTYGAPSASAAVEVFYPPAGKYYQSLHSGNTGNAPATGALFTENAAHWAECQTEYSGDDWVTLTAYAVGDQVRNPDDSRFYQCRTAHTSGATFDGTKFGIMTPFQRYVSYTQTSKTAIGEVVWVGNKNRRIFTSVVEYRPELTDLGIHFVDPIVKAWIEFSVRCPPLFGSVFSTTATYTAGQQVYFSDTATLGNFYNCITGTSAGESPVSAAAKWAVIELPYIFKTFCAQYAYSLFLIADGQHEKAAGLKAEALAALAREANKLWRRQHQVRRTRIHTR